MIRKFLNDFEKITNYYEFLVERTKDLEYVGITNEWLLDNYYLLVEHKNRIIREKKIINSKLSKGSNIESALKKIVIRNQYNLDLKKIASQLNLYQKENKYHFCYAEIDLIPTLLLFIYTAKLREVCRNEYQRFIHKDEVREVVKKIENKEITLQDFMNQGFNIIQNEDYIFELNYQLRELGTQVNSAFKELNEVLEDAHISLKDVLNNEYQRQIEHNILISNIFNNLKKFSEYTNEKLFELISYTEKKLVKDSVYNQMTDDSKMLYRQAIVKNSKRKRITEFEYVDKFYKEHETDHIGFFLFPKVKSRLRFFIYLLCIILLSSVSSYFGALYFIDNKYLGFLILIIPISQLWIQIINHILTSNIPPKSLPKLDFSKGIPKEAATMVVIPTILRDKEKIKKLFDTLETYYLVNKTKNLYFTLLGDVIQHDSAVYEKDAEICKYGLSYAKKLNQKYRQDIFHFIYRKRFYNESEKCYLGYERKRGALLQFNKLLLKKMTKREQDRNFQVHTFHDFNEKIQYVITLDIDTNLVLNTALNLVGAMAHPLNKPMLNKEKTKVISGYAIMQPRVSVDIESTNQSLYSQVFANIGGFDSYTAMVPNVYFDTFSEGNFIGKGIYDLEVFDEVLSGACPENLVLSHDLLEGNYLRCAYVSDVELIDGFPPKFLTDTSRQYRWARGDVQIASWLFPHVKNKNGVKTRNPFNMLEKFKILDNISRMFLQPMLLLILLLAIFIGKVHPVFWVVFVLLEIVLPIIFYLKSKLYRRREETQTVYYKELMVGGKSMILRSYILFATLPYYTRLYMDAFFRTLYRLLFSHKNLLNWITAEDAEKTLKFDFKTYFFSFSFNVVLAFFLVIVGFVTLNIYSVAFGLVFLSAPFILYSLSQPLMNNLEDLPVTKRDEVLEVARKTWQFFADNLTEENHYLITDNYQKNREKKLDTRTSPTDIGFSLTSIVCAYCLEFISRDKAVFYLEKIVESIESLEKWQGHLYNWYDVKTKEVLNPLFISTIDSGNLTAALIVVNQFLIEQEELKLSKRVERLIKDANFKKLYNKSDVFSIGYHINEASLSIYNYNKFASESRLTSFIAIAKGDVPSHHWFCLDKSLTSFNHRKGLISWSGTAFEYFMPLLFMKNYPHTLLDETYHFAYICQKEYINSINRTLPWGMSESAYDELDNAESYKYQAFSVPYLKAKEEKNPRIVISSYSSLMAMQLFPEDVYKNMLRLKKIGMYGEYGFYESYDLETKRVVEAYYTHHQGMGLIGLTNYLVQGAIQEYFHKDIRVQTFDILLKEKVQVQSDIDLKIAKYKKYDYEKETIQNDIRYFSSISEIPEVSVLSNKKYCLLMNDRGNSFSRYRTTQLNRYRKVTEQDYGIFCYIRNIKDNRVWSNTYAPINQDADKYEVIFASDKIKYVRTDDKITTTTEVIVTKDHFAEIRKITFTNQSEEDQILELTTYQEPTICENMDDISHRVFNNMFLSSYYDRGTNSLVTMRKKRSESSANAYLVNRLVIENPLLEYQYETNRVSFIGRNHTTSNPDAIYRPLSNKAGSPLEAIMSLRNRVLVKASSETSVYLINGFGKSKEQILNIIHSYPDALTIQKAFEVATLMNVENTKAMGLTGKDMRLYNIMLNYLYQTSRIAFSDDRMKNLRENALAQNGLWKFGISGDFPIILVDIKDIVDVGFVLDILKCFEYYKNHSIFVDIVIVNTENEQYEKLVKREIDDELYRMYTLNSFSHTPGKVVVVDGSELSKEERGLFDVVARLRFVLDDHKSLQEKVEELQQNSKASSHLQNETQVSNEIEIKDLLYRNKFGGFNSAGDEYIITDKDTPTPWSNVIANDSMGTIVTNNGCGFTYAYNSGEFKITAWSNDMVVNDKSEGIRINRKNFDPVVCKHGFGYTTLESETDFLKQSITEFVPVSDTVKIYVVKLVNKEDDLQEVDLSFWINPVLGNFEEKTGRYILSEYDKSKNYLRLRNVYHSNFSHIKVFMSCSEKISDVIDRDVMLKEIKTSITLKKQEEKEIVFTLGCSESEEEFFELLAKYQKKKEAEKALKEVKDKWKKTLSTIKVETEDDSFNFMVNGWYLYQCLSSRIMARSGFYQVSGAFGYRDQLQDTMNISYVDSARTRKQILENAAHQFREGDVLHWWHEMNHFGLRSRYKDDYLWLVYATIEYVKVTEDFKILEEEIPFALGESLLMSEVEKGIVFSYSHTKGSLLEHLQKSLHLAMNNLGGHGIPLIGGGDWNDGMNKVGIRGRGESVWLGFFLYQIIEEFVLMIEKSKIPLDVKKYTTFNQKLKKNLNDHCWDGSYYLRAFFDNGEKLGSHENSECQIDLISQSFSILSGVADKDRAFSALKEVQEKLVDYDFRIVKLLTPAFEKSLNNPGYIMNYPKGIRENGGQYTHAVSWYIMALIKMGFFDEAYRIYQMANPINRSLRDDLIERYKVEPYVIAADIYSAKEENGRGGWTWYTGSAGWFYKIAIQEILGLKKEGKSIKIEPHVPSNWNHYQMIYHYMDTEYLIIVKRGKKKKITLDGKVKRENIPLTNDKKQHKIEVTFE